MKRMRTRADNRAALETSIKKLEKRVARYVSKHGESDSFFHGSDSFVSLCVQLNNLRRELYFLS